MHSSYQWYSRSVTYVTMTAVHCVSTYPLLNFTDLEPLKGKSSMYKMFNMKNP